MSSNENNVMKVLGIYSSFTVGLILMYGLNHLVSDDIGIQILFGLSLSSIPTILLMISALTSHSIGKDCEYRLNGALHSGGVNALGALIVVSGLAIIGSNFFELFFQIVIGIIFTSFIGSMIGSIGRDIPFSDKDIEDTYYDQTIIQSPNKFQEATYSENGYEYLNLGDGSKWYRVAGGSPEPNNWIIYQEDWTASRHR
tara:strand:+ start:528 stop:1124 length:597 start_codon:yes stop_codon:yes gene_type:complete